MGREEPVSPSISRSWPQVSYVIALTIVAPAEQRTTAGSTFDVLIGVRRPECNGNHKGIASVPTKRVPETVFAAINEQRRRYAGRHNRTVEGQPLRHSEDLLYDTVESILSRKLGLADDLEYGRLTFSAEPCVFRAARSPLLTESDEPERLQMINILVYLTRGHELIPASTASYSALKWFDAKDVVARISQKNPFEFDDGHCEAKYMCGGVCICTAEVLLRKELATCKKVSGTLLIVP